MHFLFSSVGSHGDVLPLLAIAQEMRARGHRSTLLAGHGYAEAASLSGVKYIPLSDRDQHQKVIRDKAILSTRYSPLFIARHAVRWNQLILRAIEENAEPNLVVLSSERPAQRLTSYGINWRSHTEQYLDSTGIFREAVIAILAAVAKQERIRTGERTRAGLDRAREKGTRSGRPIGRPRVVFSHDRVMELRKEGHSWREIAVRLHASIAAVRRVYDEETGRPRACRKGGTEISHV